jgi:hypothetical protein
VGRLYIVGGDGDRFSEGYISALVELLSPGMQMVELALCDLTGGVLQTLAESNSQLCELMTEDVVSQYGCETLCMLLKLCPLLHTLHFDTNMEWESEDYITAFSTPNQLTSLSLKGDDQSLTTETVLRILEMNPQIKVFKCNEFQGSGAEDVFSPKEIKRFMSDRNAQSFEFKFDVNSE